MDYPEIKNRKASFEYAFIETFEAGIVLTGTEIKSIKAGKISLTEGYCGFAEKELLLLNVHIDEYTAGSHFNHVPKRPRKLLLHKTELRKLFSKSKEKGLTIIPVRMFISERGFAKLEIALAKGKKLYDKRESIKKKEAGRRMRDKE